MKTYELLDGVERNKSNPSTFSIPPPEVKECLKPGDFVKLGFEVIPRPEGGLGGERMWVRIIERDEQNFVGELDNIPVVLTELHPGARIPFESHHIIDVESD